MKLLVLLSVLVVSALGGSKRAPSTDKVIWLPDIESPAESANSMASSNAQTEVTRQVTRAIPIPVASGDGQHVDKITRSEFPFSRNPREEQNTGFITPVWVPGYYKGKRYAVFPSNQAGNVFRQETRCRALGGVLVEVQDTDEGIFLARSLYSMGERKPAFVQSWQSNRYDGNCLVLHPKGPKNVEPLVAITAYDCDSVQPAICQVNV